MIKHLDCFAGAGGFSLALEQAVGKENIEHIGFSEIDKFAIQTYQKNFPGVGNLGDISKIDIAALPDFNLLTGGFPCQDVSVAGKQNLEGGRTVLVEYLLQILEQKQPEYFVFENVKGLLSKKFNTFFESILQRMLFAGYEVDYRILNAKDYGIPQNRERVFIVGRLSPHVGMVKFPEKEELNIFLKDILEDEVDEKFYLSGETYEKLKKFESNARISDINGVPPTLSTMQGGHRQPKIITNVNPSGRGMNGQVYDSDNISPTLTTNKGEGIKIITRPHGFCKGSIRSDGICPTIRRQVDGNTLVSKTIRVGGRGSPYGSKQNWDSFNMNGGIRKLTPLECSRLQDFPDDWFFGFGLSNSQIYKQCGNAITVGVARRLFSNLFVDKEHTGNI